MKFFRLSTLVVAFLLLAPISIAGGIMTQDVNIDDARKTVRGGLSTVRHTEDRDQSLYCLALNRGDEPYGKCYARDVNNVERTCMTMNPDHIVNIQSIGDSSFLSFTWNDEGFCTELLVANGSPFGYRHE